MLDSEDYIVITKVQNGFMVSVNNDTMLDEDARDGVHVFNDRSEMLSHIDTLCAGDAIEGEMVVN